MLALLSLSTGRVTLTKEQIRGAYSSTCCGQENCVLTYETDEIEVFKGVYTLTNDTVFDSKTLVFEEGGLIDTNGHKLSILNSNVLSVGGYAGGIVARSVGNTPIEASGPLSDFKYQHLAPSRCLFVKNTRIQGVGSNADDVNAITVAGCTAVLEDVSIRDCGDDCVELFGAEASATNVLLSMSQDDFWDLDRDSTLNIDGGVVEGMTGRDPMAFEVTGGSSVTFSSPVVVNGESIVSLDREPSKAGSCTTSILASGTVSGVTSISLTEPTTICGGTIYLQPDSAIVVDVSSYPITMNDVTFKCGVSTQRCGQVIFKKGSQGQIDKNGVLKDQTYTAYTGGGGNADVTLTNVVFERIGNKEEDANAVSLAGVIALLESVQITLPGDDGIELFGSYVTINGGVYTMAGDDMLDFDKGSTLVLTGKHDIYTMDDPCGGSPAAFEQSDESSTLDISNADVFVNGKKKSDKNSALYNKKNPSSNPTCPQA